MADDTTSPEPEEGSYTPDPQYEPAPAPSPEPAAEPSEDQAGGFDPRFPAPEEGSTEAAGGTDSGAPPEGG